MVARSNDNLDSSIRHLVERGESVIHDPGRDAAAKEEVAPVNQQVRPRLHCVAKDSTVIGCEVIASVPPGHAYTHGQVEPQVGVCEEDDPQAPQGAAKSEALVAGRGLHAPRMTGFGRELQAFVSLLHTPECSSPIKDQ